MSNSGREGFELAAMFFVSGVVGADFCPEGGGVVHVVEVGELVQNYIIAQDFGDLHKPDIKRNRSG